MPRERLYAGIDEVNNGISPLIHVVVFSNSPSHIAKRRSLGKLESRGQHSIEQIVGDLDFRYTLLPREDVGRLTHNQSRIISIAALLEESDYQDGRLVKAVMDGKLPDYVIQQVKKILPSNWEFELIGVPHGDEFINLVFRADQIASVLREQYLDPKGNKIDIRKYIDKRVFLDLNAPKYSKLLRLKR
jgi:hypothetical protein